VRITAQKSFVTSAGHADGYVVSTLAHGATLPVESSIYVVLKEDAGVSVSNGSVAGSLGISAKAIDGTRVDHRTGARTVYISGSLGGRAALDLSGLEGSVGGRRDETYSVTFDATGRPSMLTVIETGMVQAGMTSTIAPRSGKGENPDVEAEPRARGSVTSGEGLPAMARSVTVETRLDLTPAENRRLAAGFIEQVTHPGLVRLHAGKPVSVELRQRLESEGIATRQVHDLEDGGTEVSAEGQISGVTFGVDGGHVTTGSRLIAASAKGADGAWYERTDCTTAARAQV
jgi:hypothetical protein